MFKFARIAGVLGVLAMLSPLAASAQTFSGTVAQVNESTIVLTNSKGESLNINASNATLQRRFGFAMTIDDVQAGDQLQVSGKNVDNSATAGSDVNATRIRDLSQKQHRAGFTGTASAISSTGFTLSLRNRPDQTVTVSSTTKITKAGQSAALIDVVSGATVNVVGLWDNAKNSIAADRVNVIVRTISIHGTVTAVNGNIITLTKEEAAEANGNGHEANHEPGHEANEPERTAPPTTQQTTPLAANLTPSTTTTPPTAVTPPVAATIWMVDATNAKLVRHFGAAMQLTDIQTGDELQVVGTISGRNIAARLIRDDSLQARNGTFVGTVTAISGSSFTLDSKSRGSQTINTSDKTKFSLGTATNDISALKVGETVTVSGVWDRANTNVTATRVSVRMISVNKAGTFQSADGTTLTLQGSDGTTFTVDASNARIRGRSGGKSVDITDLTAGDNLRIRGKMVAGSTQIVAIEVRDLSLKGNGQHQEHKNNETENEHGVNPTPAPTSVLPGTNPTVPPTTPPTTTTHP